MYSLQRHTLRRSHVKRPLTPSSVYSGRSSAPLMTPSLPPPPCRFCSVRGRTRRHHMMAMGRGGASEWPFRIADRVSVPKDLTLVSVRTEITRTHTHFRRREKSLWRRIALPRRPISTAVRDTVQTTPVSSSSTRDDASLSRKYSRKCPPHPYGSAIVGKSDFRSVRGRRVSILNGDSVTTSECIQSGSTSVRSPPFVIHNNHISHIIYKDYR